MEINLTVKPGDRVQFWTPRTGIRPLLGTVSKSEIKYGGTYATIMPDGSDVLVYLFYGAIWGFAPVDEDIHSWSPQVMGRLKQSYGSLQN